MKEGEPRHIRRASTTVDFDRTGEPKQVVASVEYYIHTPKIGPEFDPTDQLEQRVGENEAARIIDGLYDMAYGKTSELDVEDIEERLEDQGHIEVARTDGPYPLAPDEFAYEEIEIEGDFSDGIDAEFVFKVSDGQGRLTDIRNVDGITHDEQTISIKVLRLVDAAMQAAEAVPGVESVTDVKETALEYIDEGEQAEWGR